jgi:predicted nucleic acid-binding protein
VILVDTSIWVDYIRTGDSHLAALLDRASVLIHPFVIGEIAVGNLRDRKFTLRALQKLPFAETATDSEVLRFISQHRLHGLGIGYVDCHLLAGVTLTPGASFWTRDKRLFSVADRLGLAATLLDEPNGSEPWSI